MAQMHVGKFVAHPTTLGYPYNQAAAPQARQMVGHRLPGLIQQLCQLRGVSRRFPQHQQHARASRIRQRVAETGQHLAVGDRLHLTIVQ